MKRAWTLAATTIVASSMAAAPVLAGSLGPAAPEPVVVAPAPMPAAAPMAYDWTGGYVGGQLGWGSANLDDGLGGEDDGDGMIGGLRAGYDWDLGNWVVGVNGSYDAADIETDGGVSIDNVSRLGVRAGYDAGQWLFYGAGGSAWASADAGGTDLSDNGWYAGLGAEYRINERLSTGIEALYHEFDDFDDTGIDVDATTVQATVSYRF